MSYSDEMKPYMFEVCVHLLCLYGWLAITSAPTRRNWMPATLQAWRSRRWLRRP